MPSLKRTVLYNEHIDLHAKLVDFAGWEMPIQYSSVKAECEAVRQAAGVFDVGHMGEFFVTGLEAQEYLDYLLTNNIKSAEIGKAIYSPLCRENGTVIDDLIVYKLSPERLLVCVNASNIEKDWEWFNKIAPKFNVELSNHSADYSLLALQGPKSCTIMQEANLLPSNEFSYYSAKTLQHEDQEIIIARTGYTGEDGFEIFCPHSVASNIWKKLIGLGASPCGLGARDVLRLEVCFPLYGHELTDDVTPLDSALKWTVKFEKENFIGKDSLKNYKAKYRLVRLSLSKGIPRQGYHVEDQNGLVIGKVTSGTMSPKLGLGIALAHIQSDKFPENKNFFIEIRGKKYEATLHTKPFLTGGHL